MTEADLLKYRGQLFTIIDRLEFRRRWFMSETQKQKWEDLYNRSHQILERTDKLMEMFDKQEKPAMAKQTDQEFFDKQKNKAYKEIEASKNDPELTRQKYDQLNALAQVIAPKQTQK